MSQSDNADIERLDIIWGRTPVPGRGPKPSLSVEQITQAAIRLADAKGLEAVSMKRVAGAMHVGTMTLYTYIPDKATLLQLMLDRVVTNAELPAPSGDWRQHLRTSADVLLALYQQHPWMLEINVEGPPITPSQMRYLESILRVLRGTGLTGSESLDVAMSLSYYVLGAAKLTSGLLGTEQDASRRVDEMDATWTAAFQRVLDPQEFPTVFAIITELPAAEHSAGAWNDLGFDFGLERLIDGVAALIEQRSLSAPEQDE